MIRDVNPGSRNWTFLILNPGSRDQKGTGSWIRIRNTADMLPHQIIVDRYLCIRYMYFNHTEGEFLHFSNFFCLFCFFKNIHLI
jgi:hypothetical protein